VLEISQYLELSGGYVINGRIFEGDNLDCESSLGFLADGLVDTAIRSLSNLLDQLKSGHCKVFIIILK
jgi:hypothetical protein